MKPTIQLAQTQTPDGQTMVLSQHRDLLSESNNNAMQDTRVIVKLGDVADIIKQSSETYDAILLDVDNGPIAMTTSSNTQLYGPAGLAASMKALKPGGCLAIWSVDGDAKFARTLKKEGLQHQLIHVAAHKNARSKTRQIWLITKGQTKNR